MTTVNATGARGGRGVSTGKILLGVLLGVLAVLLAIYLADLAMNRGNVPRGTAVGGVEIGGMSHDEATAKLEAELGETASNPVTVKAASQSSQLVPAESGLGIDWEATVASAGEESANPFTRLAGLFRTREVDIVSTVNEAALTPQLERVAGELHLDPADGAIAIDGGEAKVTEPVPGQEVDETELFERVTTGWLNPDGVEVEPREIEPAIGDQAIKEALDGPVKAALSGALTLHGRDGVDGVIAQERIGEVVQFPNVDGKIAPEVNVESAQGILGEQLAATETQMKNARVLPGGGVEPSVDGSIIDWEAAMDGFDERLIGSAERTWDAQYKARPADFTTEEAQRATFDQVVGSFTTGGYSGASGTNIATVARVVNGAIVNPGETFSLNGYTGARGAAQGYVESVIIENGRPGKSEGGGHEIDVRTDSGALDALRPAGDHGCHIHHGRLVEVDATLLRHAVGAVHLAVVGREDDHRVVPQALGGELVEDLAELGIDKAHAVNQVVAALLPNIGATLRYVGVVELCELLVVVRA